MKVKKFKKIFSEGWGFLSFSIAFALIIRIIYYFQMVDVFQVAKSTPYGLFWNTIYSFLNSNFLISVLLSGLSVCILALSAHYINSKHLFIRAKTHLPESFIFLFFSLRPDFMTMNIYFIGSMVFVLCLSGLFSSYNANNKQRAALNACFLIVFFSLFNLALLAYLPVLWVALAVMRSLDVKSFIATLVGIIVAYFPVVMVYVLLGQSDLLLVPINSVVQDGFVSLPALGLDIVEVVALLGSILLFGLVFMNNYVDSFKDKVVVRSYNLILAVLFVMSLIFYLLLDVDSYTYEYIAISISSLILSHFYALAEEKWKVILFILQMIAVFMYFLFAFQILR